MPRARLADAVGHAEQRAVAAEDQDHVDFGRERFPLGAAAAGGRGQRGRLGFEDGVRSARPEPALDLDQMRCGRREI